MAEDVQLTGLILSGGSSRVRAVESADGRVRTPVMYVMLIDSQGHVIDFIDVGEAGQEAVAAEGFILFHTSPTNDPGFILNGVTFTYTDTPVVETDILSDIILETAIQNTLDALQNCTNPLITVATYSVEGDQINIVYNTPGTVGNSYTLQGLLAGSVLEMSDSQLNGGEDEIEETHIWTLPTSGV